jgi:hypothetical protein
MNKQQNSEVPLGFVQNIAELTEDDSSRLLRGIIGMLLWSVLQYFIQ